MKITAPIAGTTKSRAKDVSMAAFFLQDPKYDLEIHLKRWSKRLPGAILFKAAFDKPLLSDRLLSRTKAGIKSARRSDHLNDPQDSLDRIAHGRPRLAVGIGIIGCRFQDPGLAHGLPKICSMFACPVGERQLLSAGHLFHRG
jgi:hypothetical protein